MSWLSLLRLNHKPPVELEPACETLGIMAGASLGCMFPDECLPDSYRVITLFLLEYLSYISRHVEVVM